MNIIKILIIIGLLFFAFYNPQDPEDKTSVEEKKEVAVQPEPKPVPARKRFFTTRNVPVVNNFDMKDAYGQIISRCRTPQLDNQRMTNAHESTHFIHSQLRNDDVLSRRVKTFPGAFYIFPDKSFHIEQPKFLRKEIERYIPASLRFSRFNTYFGRNKSWAEYPLYIIDEFVAYINGSIVALDDHKNGQRVDSLDPMVGPIEFAVYSVATCMAIKDLDPEYWNNQEFQDFMYDTMKKSESIFKAGRNIYPYKNQEEILTNLKTSPDAENIRAFMKEHFDSFFLSID
jgi:hypothetical protein